MSEQVVSKIAAIGLLLMLLVSLILRLHYAQVNAWGYDEGMDLMRGALAGLGHKPYSEIFVSNPPLTLLTTQLAASLFGDTLSARYPMILYSLIGVASIYWLVRQSTVSKPVMAGLLASVFLSFGPHYFLPSASLNLEVPALALALLSVALVEYYRARPSYVWLVLSGVAFAFSLALKVFVVFLPLVVISQLLAIIVLDGRMSLWQRQTAVRLIKMGIAWLIGPLVVVGFFALVYDPAAMYRDVILFRLASRDLHQVASAGIQGNITILRQEIGQYVPLMIGALLGLLSVGRGGLARIWLWPIWLVLASGFLLVHTPLRPRHTVLLLPPLAALSSISVAALTAWLSHRLKRWGTWLTVVILIVVCGWSLLGPVRALTLPPDEHPFDARHPEVASAALFVRQTTAPSDCIVVDDQRFAWLAERWVPPSLAETSITRLSIGWLTSEQIINVAEEHDCPDLVFQTNRFDAFVPDLRQAAASLYSLRLEFRNPEKSHKITVYAVKMNTGRAPAQIVNRALGGQVTLKGVDLSPPPWGPGQTVVISTYWQAQRQPDRDYKIFVHVKDASGQVVASFDHYPFESSHQYLIHHTVLNEDYLEGQSLEDFASYPATGLIPTRLWVPGNTLKETITITWPDTIPPGSYRIAIGMYDEVAMEPLAVSDDQSEGDVPTIQVVD